MHAKSVTVIIIIIYLCHKCVLAIYRIIDAYYGKWL